MGVCPLIDIFRKYTEVEFPRGKGTQSAKLNSDLREKKDRDYTEEVDKEGNPAQESSIKTRRLIRQDIAAAILLLDNVMDDI